MNRVISANSFELKPVPLASLVICDPPYGGIVKQTWDIAHYQKWFSACEGWCLPDATIAIWGGIGKPLDRPFIEFFASVERDNPGWKILTLITWGKKRAYGKANNYLFTREECLILQRGKPVFNIPLLDKERGYAGFDPKYPAKSPFLRRTNVWSDINELFRGKTHPTEKPLKLYEVLIVTHSNPGDLVVDLCAGSGVTHRAAVALGRRSIIVEKNMTYLVDAGFKIIETMG